MSDFYFREKTNKRLPLVSAGGSPIVESPPGSHFRAETTSVFSGTETPVSAGPTPMVPSPPIATLMGYTPNEQQLIALLWDRQPRSYDELRQHERFCEVKPASFDKYVRRLANKLLAQSKGTLWLDLGRTVVHGPWCRLSGTICGTNF
jgi:hypothetical protein